MKVIAYAPLLPMLMPGRVSLLIALSCLLAACGSSAPKPPPGMQVFQEAVVVALTEHPLERVSPNAPFELAPVVQIPLALLKVYRPITQAASAFVVNEEGSRVYIGTREGSVFELKRAEDGRSLVMNTLLESSRPVFALALSKDGRRLALSQYSYVGVIDLEKRKLQSQLSIVDGRILTLAWDARADLLALGRANGDVFIWDGKENDARQLEQYSSATSPVVGLAFHPRSRSLFVLERSGGLSLWRILRTEFELGLRDEAALSDSAQVGRWNVPIGVLPGGGQAIWVSSKGDELLALSQSGSAFSWDLRGLVRGQTQAVGALNAVSLVGLRTGDSADVPLMMLGGRGQQVQFWCRAVRPELTVEYEEVSVVAPGESLAPKTPEELLKEQLEAAFEVEEEEEIEFEPPSALVASTAVMRPTVVFAAASRESAWIAFSDGHLAELSLDSVFSLHSVQRRLHNCIDLIGP